MPSMIKDQLTLFLHQNSRNYHLDSSYKFMMQTNSIEFTLKLFHIGKQFMLMFEFVLKRW